MFLYISPKRRKVLYGEESGVGFMGFTVPRPWALWSAVFGVLRGLERV